MKCTIVDDVVWCDVMCCGVNPSTVLVVVFTFFDLAQVFFMRITQALIEVSTVIHGTCRVAS